MTAAERRSATLAGLLRWKDELGFSNVPVEVMMGQSDLETGGWTSSLCVNWNNAWGMTFPSQRDTMAVGKVRAEGQKFFCIFDSLEDGAKDYLMRQREFDIPNTSDPLAYIEATVASGYASGANYATAWASRIVDMDEELAATEDEGGGLAVPIALGLVLWGIS